MAVSNDQPAPYATTGSVLHILGRYRNHGMQTPFTKDVLGRAGVSDSLIPRTIQSLQILDLIDEDGMPTDTLESIRVASSNEYQARLAEWIKSAYADVFSFVDPSQDDETAIRDAFRTYTPVGQQDRMVKLFIGLCEEAGIREKTEQESKPRAPRAPTRQTTRRQQTKKKKDQFTDQDTSNIPPALVGLLKSLPPEGQGLTQEEHEKFKKAFGAMLEFCYPIVEEKPEKSVKDDGDDATESE